jgi:hypothetical protein
MEADKKKALLVDVRNAFHALGRILDGGHDLYQLKTFSHTSIETLRDSCMTALAGLALLDALLVSEIGTDNLPPKLR